MTMMTDSDAIDLDAQPPYPIWVLPVGELLALERLETHEELRARGALVRWTKGMGDFMFVSHTWLRYDSPDGERGEKITLLKELLAAIRAGALDIRPNWATQFVLGEKYWMKAKDLQSSLTDGYVWFDLCSIPQAERATQLLAIRSIPWYAFAASFFVVLVGSSWVHESGKVRGAAEWARRGWCRLEQLANCLSPTEKPMVVCQSLTNIETYPARGFYGSACPRFAAGEGDFTVEDDRKQLGPVIRRLIASRKASALAAGDLVSYRVVHVMSDRMLANTGTAAPREASLDAWLRALRFSAPTDRDHKLTALHYAVLSGRVDLAAELLERGADGEALTGNMEHMLDFVVEGTPILGLAVNGRYQPEMVRMLLSRGFDPRAPGAKTYKSMVGNAFVCATFMVIRAPKGAAGAAAGAAGRPPVYNLDVLLEHDPSLIETRQALFGGTNSALGLGMCGAPLEFLHHLLDRYPERCKHELATVDGMGATWLTHYLNYGGDPAVINALLDAGLDPCLAAWPPNWQPRLVMLVFRTLCRLRRTPDNATFQFANFFGQPVPTYLHLAAAYAQAPALELLLERTRLDVNGKNLLGATPLHLAARQGHTAIVQMLLAAGADPNAADERGNKPADMARRRGHGALVQRLEAAERAHPSWRPPPSAAERALVWAAPVAIGIGIALVVRSCRHYRRS